MYEEDVDPDVTELEDSTDTSTVIDRTIARLMTWEFGDFIQLLCVCETNLVLLHGLLCDVVQVGAEELSALDVVALVELLVDRVGGVGAAAHGQEKHVLAGGSLECEGDGDGAALTGEVGLDAPDALDGLCGGGEVGVVGRGDPPLAGVLQGDIELVLGLQLGEGLLHVLEDELVDVLGLHVGDCADAELASDLCGNHGLGARGGECALDTVEGERGETPPAHEGALLLLEEAGLAAERLVKVVHGEVDVLVDLLLLLGDGSNELLDAVDENVSRLVDETGHHADEVGHGLVSGTAVHTRVEILTRAADLNAVVAAATKTVGEARLLGAEPVVVADADDIGILEELAGLALLNDEVVQTLGAVLLHTLEAHQQVDGELDAGLLVCLDRVDPSEHGALVVGAATSEHPSLVVNGELERLGVPAIREVGGLHIVVSVNQDGALGLVLLRRVATDDRGRQSEVLLVRLWPKLARLHVCSQVLELLLEVVAHLDHIGSPLILGGDGRDGDGVAETGDEGIGQVVDALEVGVELGSHFRRRFGAVDVGPDASVWCEEAGRRGDGPGGELELGG